MNIRSAPAASSVIGSATAWPGFSELRSDQSIDAAACPRTQHSRSAAISIGLDSQVTIMTSVAARSAAGRREAQ